MPSLFNTVGDLYFYNFISNQYPNGVPSSLVDTFEASSRLTQWLANQAFSGTATLSADNAYFYWPAVASSPTELETITSASTSVYRVRITSAYNFKTIGVENGGNNYFLSTNLNGGGNGVAYEFYPTSTDGVYPVNNVTIDTLTADYFSFGVKSPSSLMLLTYHTNTETDPDRLTDIDVINVFICGWLHESVYANSSSVLPLSRYKNLFGLSIVCRNPTSSTTYNDLRATYVNLTEVNSYGTFENVYYDIDCAVGSYTAGTFISDLIMVDEERRQVGKVDNRIACLGRGNFQIGRVYNLVDPFGRTGSEQWLCVSYYTPSTYTLPTWYPGLNRVDLMKAWKDGEYDFILVRVYTEAD